MKKHVVQLRTLAFARSGDKGAHANIGVIARSKEAYDCLVKELTANVVAAFFKDLAPAKVKRYELPNLQALNFILEGVLQGGGSRSLRSDAQGKALGQAILEMPINITEETHAV